MDNIRRKVTKEVYDEVKAGGLSRQDKHRIFGYDIVEGYGLYGYDTEEKDGEYFITFSCGSSCD